MTERIERVNELLKSEVGALLLRELDVPQGALVTVTRVAATPNLQQARIYISVMPEEKRKEVFGMLRRQVYEIQQQLNKRLYMRPVPRIQWMPEEKTKEAQEVEQILEHIKKKQ